MNLAPTRYRLDEALRAVRTADARVPSIAVVLGSGLGPFADTLLDPVRLPYDRIPYVQGVSVPGHSGALVIGTLAGTTATVAAFAGRVHFYEGHDIADVVFPVRLAVALGARTVVLTNAAGGVDPTLSPGDLALITDHINLQGTNPLLGPNDPTLGPRFPDLSSAYDPHLRALAHDAAKRVGVTLREGVYAGVSGPSYETPAEIRMLRMLGAHLVGMSTVPETIAARHMGARVLGLSCVTNHAAGVTDRPLSHTEVEATAKATRATFARLLHAVLGAIHVDGSRANAP